LFSLRFLFKIVIESTTISVTGHTTLTEPDSVSIVLAICQLALNHKVRSLGQLRRKRSVAAENGGSPRNTALGIDPLEIPD
jgi:hypothetical protein